MEKIAHSKNPNFKYGLLILLLIIPVSMFFILNRAKSDYEIVKKIRFTIKIEEVDPSIAKEIQNGDEILNAAGGMMIGRVVTHTVQPYNKVVPTFSGGLNLAQDPYSKSILVNVEGEGKSNIKFTSLKNMVIQTGTRFRLTSSKYNLTGTIIKIRTVDD